MKQLTDPIAALRSLRDAPRAAKTDVLPILASVRIEGGSMLFGVDAAGAHCALVCRSGRIKGVPTFKTEVFRCESVARLELLVDCVREHRAALVLRCDEAADFSDVFGALLVEVVAIFARLDGVEAWGAVGALLDRWSSFFWRPRELSESVSLGLWGELKAILAADDAEAMVAAWRGGEGGVYDFFRAGVALEVKAGARKGVHRVSHAQVASEVAEGGLVSLHALVDPKGDALVDLHARILAGLDETGSYYEALRRRGVTPRAIAKCDRRWSLASVADVYDLGDVPRIRSVPAGVSELSYKVTLDQSKRLDPARVGAVLSPFGLDLKKLRGV